MGRGVGGAGEVRGGDRVGEGVVEAVRLAVGALGVGGGGVVVGTRLGVAVGAGGVRGDRVEFGARVGG